MIGQKIYAFVKLRSKISSQNRCLSRSNLMFHLICEETLGKFRIQKNLYILLTHLDIVILRLKSAQWENIATTESIQN